MNLATNKSYFVLALFLVTAMAVGVLGAYFTADQIEDWYVHLDKPSFTPPGWLFGPVWTGLYILMGIAAYLIWERRWADSRVNIALKVYAAQLLVNGSWSLVFFGRQSLVGGLIIIVLLDLLVLELIWLAFKIRKSAAFILMPYLILILFATALNISIVMLN